MVVVVVTMVVTITIITLYRVKSAENLQSARRAAVYDIDIQRRGGGGGGGGGG